MSVSQRPLVWVFAGSDSCAAAGAQADIKTLERFGIHASTVLTAITAQTPTTCLSVYPLPQKQVSDQIGALSAGPAPKVIKVGMIASRDAFSLLRGSLSQQQVTLVLDPVLMSSSGVPLSGDVSAEDLLSLTNLCPTILTPNAPEAEALTGIKIERVADLPTAGALLLDAGAATVVIKGGHLDDTRYVYDYCTSRNGSSFFMRTPRHAVKNLRGTGCTFASAVTAGLAQGLDIDDALVLARSYLNQCFIAALRHTNDTAVIDHQDPLRSSEVIPDVSPYWGEKMPDLSEEYSLSSHHKTGFYVIADSASWVKKLTEWGVPTVQLRIKHQTGTALAHEIAAAIEAVRGSNTALYINDYWQEAIAAGAFGVHLGQEDLEHADVKKIKSAGLRLGLSTHSWYEAAVAQTYKPSYIALGPIFPTTCKSMRFGPQGFAKLREWVGAWKTPVVAIGGLSLGDAHDLQKAGCGGAAVISDVLNAADPKARAMAWLGSLRS